MDYQQPTAEERQECLSNIYVHAARIIGPLEGGRFAVCAMARGHIIGMLEGEDIPEVIRAAAAESIRAYDAGKAAERQRIGALREPVVMGANAPEDLGL